MKSVLNYRTSSPSDAVFGKLYAHGVKLLSYVSKLNLYSIFSGSLGLDLP